MNRRIGGINNSGPPDEHRQVGGLSGRVESQVEVPVDGFVLEGSLVVPSRPRGVVLFAHGSGSSRLSPRNRAVAAGLQQAGLATLLFDLLTRSEERADEADGHLRFDVHLLARRLEVATRWIVNQRPTHSFNVGYFGSSTGAAAALIAAATLGPTVSAVVSRGGRADLAGAALREVRSPTLLIVGGRDEQVLALNRAALARLSCEKRLEVIPGATHLFEEPGALTRVTEFAADWFGRHLSSTSSRSPAGRESPSGTRVEP